MLWQQLMTDWKCLKSILVKYFFDHDSLIINREVCPKLTCQHFISFYNLDFLQDYLKQHGYTTTIKRPGDGYFPFLYIEN